MVLPLLLPVATTAAAPMAPHRHPVTAAVLVVVRMETSLNVAGRQVQLRHPLVVALTGRPCLQTWNRPGNVIDALMRLVVGCPLSLIHIHTQTHVAIVSEMSSIAIGDHHRVRPSKSKKSHARRVFAFLHRRPSVVVSSNITNSKSHIREPTPGGWCMTDILRTTMI